MEGASLEAKRQELAASLDCITSSELRALAGITEKTEETWRKQRKGPPYVLLGTQYLYPRKGVVKFIEGLVREPQHVPAKGLL